ncbi:hypothetical protein DVH05_020460 [Phytophthora capsici]|nr:hypothetical protein DVH05_020460 [Phytophthora capsici]
MASIQQAVNAHHALTNTIMHAPDGYFPQGLSKQRLATIYNKHINTISNWISASGLATNTGGAQQSGTGNPRQSSGSGYWITTRGTRLHFSMRRRLRSNTHMLYFDLNGVEALRQHGLMWEVLERRAMNIKTNDIVRFTLELNTIKWSQMNIQFLGEVSFDNKGMFRSRGYCLNREKFAFHGEFNRKAPPPETFHTDGTFERSKFVECCRAHTHSRKTAHQRFTTPDT